MKFCAMTDIGKKRPTNQDAFCVGHFGENAEVLLLCDGMGGHRGGNVASELAVCGLYREVSDFLPTVRTPKDLRWGVYNALSAVNRTICTAANGSDLSGMGSTVAGIIRVDAMLCCFHVGDSRIYRLRDGAVQRLTTDHSLVQGMIDRGEISPDRAVLHPYRHVITRVLGSLTDWEPEITVSDWSEGDRYLLCSDGLTNAVGEDELASALRCEDTDGIARGLIGRVLENGAPDNVTVAILFCEKERAE